MPSSGSPRRTRAAGDLRQRFLAGDVQRRQRRRHLRQRLQQQRRLADARIAADQHHRAFDQAAAEHAVEFADAGRTRALPRCGARPCSAVTLRRIDLARPSRRAALAGALPTMRLPARFRSACSRRRIRRTGPATCCSRRRIRCRRRRSDWISCLRRLWPLRTARAWTMAHCSCCSPTACDNASAKSQDKKRPGRSPALRRHPWRASLSESRPGLLARGLARRRPLRRASIGLLFFPTLSLTGRSRPKPRCGSNPRTAATVLRNGSSG